MLSISTVCLDQPPKYLLQMHNEQLAKSDHIWFISAKFSPWFITLIMASCHLIFIFYDTSSFSYLLISVVKCDREMTDYLITDG